MAEGGFSAQEKKSAKSLIVCFLALECGYWQVSQCENWVSSVCMVPPEVDFSGDYHQEVGRARKTDYVGCPNWVTGWQGKLITVEYYRGQIPL